MRRPRSVPTFFLGLFSSYQPSICWLVWKALIGHLKAGSRPGTPCAANTSEFNKHSTGLGTMWLFSSRLYVPFKVILNPTFCLKAFCLRPCSPWFLEKNNFTADSESKYFLKCHVRKFGLKLLQTSFQL